MNYINYVVEPKVQKGSGRIKAELREVFRRFGLIMIGPSELSLYYVRLTEVSVKDVSVIRQGIRSRGSTGSLKRRNATGI